MLNLIQVVLVIWLGGWIFIAPVAAATQEFHWQGEAGYAIAGKLSYDETEASQTITTKSVETANRIQSLSVTFYSPEGKPIHTYHNVIDGVAQGNYLEFNFDTTTHLPVGKIDLGGELAGETYLKGTVDGKLSWIAIEPSGAEHIIDKLSCAKSS